MAAEGSTLEPNISGSVLILFSMYILIRKVFQSAFQQTMLNIDQIFNFPARGQNVWKIIKNYFLKKSKIRIKKKFVHPFVWNVSTVMPIFIGHPAQTLWRTPAWQFFKISIHEPVWIGHDWDRLKSASKNEKKLVWLTFLKAKNKK